MERILILDSNSLMNRAFYALPPLTNSEGIHTNAVYGFTNMLLKLQEELNPDYVVATFDRKAPTFRHKEYEGYKAGRKKMPPELAEQFPIMKELLNLLAINIFEIDGFEADDLIGTLSKFCEKEGIEVFIVTGDKDALQLASKNIKVIITKKGITEKEIYDEQRMIDDYGVTPTEFIDVKGLMGDTSDNIPGVPGIGEKTAFKLIQTYGSIEEVLNHIDEIKGKKVQENLREYREQAIFSKKLATIVTEVPIEIDLEDIKSQKNYDSHKIKDMFYKLQFKSLLDRIQDDDEEDEEVNFILIKEQEQLDELVNLLQKEKKAYITFDIKDPSRQSTIGLNTISITSDDKVYIVDMESIEKNQQALSKIKIILENENIEKVVFDVKNGYTALEKLHIDLRGVKFDIKIGAYLIDSSKGEYEIKTLINEYLHKDIKGEALELKAKEAKALEPLYQYIINHIKDYNMEELLYNIELPLTKVLSSMETLGFKVNSEILDELGKKFNGEIVKLQQEIYDLAEEEFNINSPKQLGKILFEKLDLPVIKKTKTGYSTNAEVLEALSDKHPIIEKILYYRQLAKLYSTYIEGLKAVIDQDSKIHSSFNQTVTTTGRLSSTEPNLQNIPIKYEMGREIRKVFIPDNKDCVILSADYSQIELRVLAHIAGDENLIDAFKHHSDIHTKTASEVFKVAIEDVTPIMRSRAKAVNFGIVYGISDFSLAKDLKIPRKEAKEYIDVYFERYPKVKEFIENIIAQGKSQGYVTTIVNRRRYIPEINSSNKIVKALGDRLAMNTPIQGSAADIIKLAMVRVYDELKNRKLKSTLILQVHDELILNVYRDELEVVQDLVKEQMEKVMDLSVPLEVDINIGENWYEAK